MEDQVHARFAEGVMARLDRLSGPSALRAGAVERSAETMYSPPVGHPSFQALDVGETATCPVAVAFIDMRAMTARSFWEPLEAITHLSLAVLGQIAEVVLESGGHVLGMRGDGLMAGWGEPGSDPNVDVAMCMAAASFSLDAVEGGLNELLQMRGTEPVQVSAGADWGPVCFARTGTPMASEINVVGHPANFAAKCEKLARSWEVVVGEGATSHLPAWVCTPHEKSPKTYQHQGHRRSYSFSHFSWRAIVNDAAGAIAQVGGRSTSLVNPHWEDPLR